MSGPRAEVLKRSQMPSLAGFSHLLVVQSKREGADEIAEQLRNGAHPLGRSALLAALAASGAWAVRDHRILVAFVTAEVTVLERRAPPPR